LKDNAKLVKRINYVLGCMCSNPNVPFSFPNVSFCCHLLNTKFPSSKYVGTTLKLQSQ